jgi:hypothetical protein
MLLLAVVVTLERMEARDDGWSNERWDRQIVAVEAVSEKDEVQTITGSPPPPNNCIPGYAASIGSRSRGPLDNKFSRCLQSKDLDSEAEFYWVAWSR